MVTLLRDPVIILDGLAMVFTAIYLAKLAFADFVALEEQEAECYRHDTTDNGGLFDVGSFISAHCAPARKRYVVGTRA